MNEKEYEIEIIETYKYDLKIKAKSRKESIKKAKKYYSEIGTDANPRGDGCIGVPSALSFDNVKFSIKVNK